MTPAFNSRHRVRRFSLAVVALASALLPAAAGAMSLPPDGSSLSPRLAELARPAARSAPRATQAARLSLPAAGPGSLLRDGGRLVIEARFAPGAAVEPGPLEAAGAQVLQVSERYRAATATVAPADLRALGSLPVIAAVDEVLRPLVRATDCGGSARSEGDALLNAANARSSFAVDGSGVTVGVLSDSFDRALGAATHAAEDVAGGDLPGPGSPCGSASPVAVLDDSDAAGKDEGRAMAQTVHDLAPGAAIDFATAFTGELQFAANIRALAAAGAQVIADDVSYVEEPFFQDGPVATAIADVVGSGVSYFSAAGNDNLIDSQGRDIASWEAPAYRDSGACPAAIVTLSEEIEEAEKEKGLEPQGLHPTHCLDFDPGAAVDETFGISVEAGATLSLDLQWAEPWNGVGSDLDAFLLDEAGNLLEAKGFPVASAEDNVVDQRPLEFLGWENEGPAAGVQLVVNRFSGGDPRLKFALLQNGGGVSETEYPQSSGGDVVGPTVFGHSGAAAAIAAGAVPYDNGASVERYSSRGPVKHYFGPVAGTAPAPATGETVVPKPDLAATDCGVTTFFLRPTPSSPPPFRFCGTSAAAPHAAAVAALMRQANPGAGAPQVRAALTATARPVGPFGPDAAGAGLIDAYGAVAALALPPAVTITKPPQPLGRERQPTIEFAASRPVAFSCQVDGGTQEPCASPYRLPQPLRDGTHGVAVSAVDRAGRSASAVAYFSVDTRAPRTTIARHPRKLIRTPKRRVRAVFRFRADEPGAVFVCKVDRGLLHFCGPRFARRFGAGHHVLLVRAQDPAGNVDRTPARFRFRVERVG
jgi:hypothetical protein